MTPDEEQFYQELKAMSDGMDIQIKLRAEEDRIMRAMVTMDFSATEQRILDSMKRGTGVVVIYANGTSKVVNIDDVYSGTGAHVLVIDEIDRHLTINQTSTRRGFQTLPVNQLASALALCDPGYLTQPDPPPVDDWYPKPLSKKNYRAPRQSFKARMRSVNRNR